jgi:hypothetical protein
MAAHTFFKTAVAPATWSPLLLLVGLAAYAPPAFGQERGPDLNRSDGTDRLWMSVGGTFAYVERPDIGGSPATPETTLLPRDTSSYRAAGSISGDGLLPGAQPVHLGAGYFFAGGEIVSSPKPVKIDGDTRPAIVFGTSLGEIHLLTADGLEAAGWPVQSGSQVGYSSPAVADLDGDLSQDIVVHANGALEVYAQDGSVLPGWPRTLDSSVGGNSMIGSPVVADIDDNGDLEIVVGHFQRMYAFHHDGTTVAGWPVVQAHPFGPLFATPAVADLDGNGDLEPLSE